MVDRDVEVLGHALLDVREHLRRVPVGEALVVDDDVRGERRQPGRDRGGVQVVDLADVIQLEELDDEGEEEEPFRLG